MPRISFRAHLLWACLLLSQKARTQGPLDTAAPLIISPSGEWDGPDGPWASYNLGVGGEIEALKSFPSMSSSTVILPFTDWCYSSDVKLCQVNNITFDPQKFSTWTPIGFFTVSEVEPFVDRDSFAGIFGTDSVIFGRSANDVKISNQTVAGIITKHVPMSLFGLSARPMDFGQGPVSNLITNLKNFATIPSNSFSYTAGSFNRNASTSLILGGFDYSRFDPQTTIQGDLGEVRNFGQFFVRVNISSISISGEKAEAWVNPANFPLTTTIDSAFPQLWLPEGICYVFERAFDLVWNETAQLYLVNETHHSALLRRNASVTFTLETTPGV